MLSHAEQPSYYPRTELRHPQLEVENSDAFRLRYNPDAPTEAIIKDVQSYLGEYRLQVQTYDFSLDYSNLGDGMHIRSPDDGEAMLLKANKGLNDVPTFRQDKIRRRTAELVNIQTEEQILAQANNGDLYFYFSPPDPDKEDEEGKYGFAYVNQVAKLGDLTKVNKTAIRIESQNISHYQAALSALARVHVDYDSPEDFIANPVPLAGIEREDIDAVLSSTFSFTSEADSKTRFDLIMASMQPQIEAFVGLIKNEAHPEDIQKAFHALENKALELKTLSVENLITLVSSLSDGPKSPSREDFMGFVMNYGFVPPAVGGSCGSTVVGESASMFGFNSTFSSLGVGGGSGGGETKEACVTCPYCQNKKGNYKMKTGSGEKYMCGNKGCKSNKK